MSESLQASFSFDQFDRVEDIPGDYCPIQGRWYPVRVAGEWMEVRIDYNNLQETRQPAADDSVHMLLIDSFDVPRGWKAVVDFCQREYGYGYLGCDKLVTTPHGQTMSQVLHVWPGSRGSLEALLRESPAPK